MSHPLKIIDPAFKPLRIHAPRNHRQRLRSNGTRAQLNSTASRCLPCVLPGLVRGSGTFGDGRKRCRLQGERCSCCVTSISLPTSRLQCASSLQLGFLRSGSGDLLGNVNLRYRSRSFGSETTVRSLMHFHFLFCLLQSGGAFGHKRGQSYQAVFGAMQRLRSTIASAA